IFAFGALTVLITITGRTSAYRLWQYAEDAQLVAVSGAGCRADDNTVDCEACGYVQKKISGSRSWQRCRRCQARVFDRKPETHARVWAFLIAAAILYIPANVLPVMKIRLPTGVSTHTILGGIIELWQMG